MKILLRAIYPYAFLLLFLILPFDNYVRVLPNILLVVLIAAFPFVVSKADFQKLKSIPVLVFLTFIIYLTLIATIHGRLESDMNIIKKVLIAFGLLILYIPVNDADKLKKAIIFSSLATILFSVINIIIVYNTSEAVIYKSYPLLIESLLIDRIYLGFLSVLGILFCYGFLRPKYHPENRYYIIYIIINILFLVLIVSKVALLILFIIFVISQFYGNSKKIRIFLTVFILAVLAITYVSVAHNLKEQNYLASEPYSDKNFIRHTLTWDIRTIVWHCASAVAEETGLTMTGLGFAETKNQLASCYEAQIEDPEKRSMFVSERFNTHNQFIDFYLSAGIIGLLLFVGLFGYLFYTNRKQFFATALIITLTAYCFMENIFHRQIGAYYAGLILMILITQTWNESNKVVKDTSEG